VVRTVIEEDSGDFGHDDADHREGKEIAGDEDNRDGKDIVGDVWRVSSCGDIVDCDGRSNIFLYLLVNQLVDSSGQLGK